MLFKTLLLSFPGTNLLSASEDFSHPNVLPNITTLQLRVHSPRIHTTHVAAIISAEAGKDSGNQALNSSRVTSLQQTDRQNTLQACNREEGGARGIG